MPNIELRGYPPQNVEFLKSKIDKVLQLIGFDEEAITTVIQSIAESCGRSRVQTPYLRVCSTNFKEIEYIMVAFQENNIYEDTEILVLSGFISKEKMKTDGLLFKIEGDINV